MKRIKGMEWNSEFEENKKRPLYIFFKIYNY